MNQRLKFFHPFLFCLLFGVACSSPPLKKIGTVQETTAFEAQSGSELVNWFEPRWVFWPDPDCRAYLTQLVEKLFKSVIETGNISSHVQILLEQKKRYWNASLPPDRIYVSLALLKKMNYETELAASLAIEVVLLHQKFILKRLAEAFSESPALTKGIDSLRLEERGPQGWFVIPHSEHLKLVPQVVQVLYAAGFDPRGLFSYYQLLQTLGEKSLYSEWELEELKMLAREECIKLPPLLNPVVRSSLFYGILQKVKQK